MKKYFLFILPLLLSGLSCCGSTPQFTVTTYPFGATPRTTCEGYLGTVFFNFEALNSNDIDDYKEPRNPITHPIESRSNFKPTASSFDITGAAIDENTCYRVTMICALPAELQNQDPDDPQFSYISKPSCAFQKAAGSLNNINLCFGAKSDIESLSSCQPLAGPCPTLNCTTAVPTPTP